MQIDNIDTEIYNAIDKKHCLHEISIANVKIERKVRAYEIWILHNLKYL